MHVPLAWSSINQKLHKYHILSYVNQNKLLINQMLFSIITINLQDSIEMTVRFPQFLPYLNTMRFHFRQSLPHMLLFLPLFLSCYNFRQLFPFFKRVFVSLTRSYRFRTMWRHWNEEFRLFVRTCSCCFWFKVNTL